MSSHVPERVLPQIPDAVRGDDRPLGVLEVRRDGNTIVLPLCSIDYRASVCECVADVTLTEVFENPFAEHLEAVYTFPLSGGAAVRSFELEVAGRTIRGLVKERGEAREEYRRAIEAGKRAALLEQERDNVFTVQVGNLPPGERATVRLSYAERLELFDDGRTELRLPLVVAPRYVPGTSVGRQNSGSGVEDDTDEVPDASRVTPPRLAHGSTVGPEVAVEVTLVGGGNGFADLASSQHATALSLAGGGLVVRLAKTTERADRDFVVRWRFAGERVRSSLSVFRHESRGLFGMLTVAAPPAGERRAAPRDVVFLLDRSGSMQGLKMQSAARACALLLESLGPEDRYTVAAFDTTVEWMDGTPGFLAADETGIARGTRFLRSVDARGGTEIAPALEHVFAALDSRSGGREHTPVVVVVTDGEVTNESQVLKLVERRIGRGRLFAVGIDTAVNDALLRRLAAAGRGTASLVAPGDELERALRGIAREIGTPEVVDLAIEDLDAGLRGEQAPERAPDLFAGRAATIFLRLESFGAVRLRGRRADGREYVEELRAEEVESPAIAHLWARARVSDLEDRYRAATAGRDQIKQEIVDVSIAHQIVTRFTAYLAVDDAEVVNTDGSLRRVVQPVEMPADWEQDRQQAWGAPAVVMSSMPTGGAQMPYLPQSMPAPSASRDEYREPPRAGMPERWSAAPPPAPKSSGIGSLVGRLLPSFGGRKDQAKREAPPRSGIEKLVEALEALARLLGDAVARAARGETVDLARVETARREALDLARAAARSPLVARVVALVEREPSSDAQRRALLELVEKRLLPDLRRELGGSTAGGSFWESSI